MCQLYRSRGAAQAIFWQDQALVYQRTLGFVPGVKPISQASLLGSDAWERL